MTPQPVLATFSGLRLGPLELHLITNYNAAELRGRLARYPDADNMLNELQESYLPTQDKAGRTNKYGF